MASRQEATVRAEARRRRQELDRERDAADARVEDLTAGVLMAIAARDLAQEQLEARSGELGAALRGLLTEDVPVERAAALTQLSEAEVRRLNRPAGTRASAAPESGPVRWRGAGARRRDGRGPRSCGLAPVPWSGCAARGEGPVPRPGHVEASTAARNPGGVGDAPAHHRGAAARHSRLAWAGHGHYGTPCADPSSLTVGDIDRQGRAHDLAQLPLWAGINLAPAPVAPSPRGSNLGSRLRRARRSCARLGCWC